MSTASTHDVTRLLHAWSGGSPQASEQLLALLYDDLRRIARDYMSRERAGHTLQPTALVHEAYLRLTRGHAIEWQGRAHFFGLAARAMRRVLVNHARDRGRLKRQGGEIVIALADAGEIGQPAGETGVNIIAIDAALEQLAAAYPRPSRVVEFRFFAGMESRDIAEVLQVSEKTVLRDWQFAKLWLHRELATEHE